MQRGNWFIQKPGEDELALALSGVAAALSVREPYHVYIWERGRAFASRAKGSTVKILAIWFGVAAVAGLLLGYAARRLKSAPKGRNRSINNADTRDDDAERQRTSSGQSSVGANKH